MTPQEAALTALVEEQRLQNTQLLTQNSLLTERCAQLETENKLLRQKVDLLVRRCFGAKSESLSPAQLELLLTGNEEPPLSAPPGKSDASRVASTAGDTLEAVPPEHAPAPPKTARRPRLPEHLPVVEEPERSGDGLPTGQPRRGERQRISSSIRPKSWPILTPSAASAGNALSSSTTPPAAFSSATPSGANTSGKKTRTPSPSLRP